MHALSKFVKNGVCWSGGESGLLTSRSVEHTLHQISVFYPTRAVQQQRGLRLSVLKLANGAYSDRSIRSALSILVITGLIRRVRTKQAGLSIDDVCKTYINPTLIALAREWAREQLVLNYPKPPSIHAVELPMAWPATPCIVIAQDDAGFKDHIETEKEIENALL